MKTLLLLLALFAGTEHNVGEKQKLERFRERWQRYLSQVESELSNHPQSQIVIEQKQFINGELHSHLKNRSYGHYPKYSIYENVFRADQHPIEISISNPKYEATVQQSGTHWALIDVQPTKPTAQNSPVVPMPISIDGRLLIDLLSDPNFVVFRVNDSEQNSFEFEFTQPGKFARIVLNSDGLITQRKDMDPKTKEPFQTTTFEYIQENRSYLRLAKRCETLINGDTQITSEDIFEYPDDTEKFESKKAFLTYYGLSEPPWAKPSSSQRWTQMGAFGLASILAVIFWGWKIRK